MFLSLKMTPRKKLAFHTYTNGDYEGGLPNRNGEKNSLELCGDAVRIQTRCLSEHWAEGLAQVTSNVNARFYRGGSGSDSESAATGSNSRPQCISSSCAAQHWGHSASSSLTCEIGLPRNEGCRERKLHPGSQQLSTGKGETC